MGDPVRTEFVDNSEIARLSDQELTFRLQILAADERTSLVALLAHLAEFDRRKLYGPLGCSSLFTYCTTRLRFSEEAAYRRIHAARVSQKYPEALPMIADGRLQLSAIAALSVHLTDDNHLELLDRACDKSFRDVQRVVASLAPQPEKADVIRRSPESEPAQPAELSFTAPISSSEPASPIPSPRIEPVAPDRVRFSFTGDEALLRKVERAQAILWHKHPAGRLEDIFAEALDFLLDKKDPERRLEKKKRLKRRPAPILADTESRRIPQWVKDEVWARDGGQCAFIPPDGTRCPEREGLEFDHIMPWALGGRSHDPRNIRLLCRGHNQMRGRDMFGGE
jgi:hypothetical protein